MDELIIRMPEDIRNKLLVQLLHKTTKYKDKVEQLILTYLNRLFEKSKIPNAFKEHYEKTKERQEQKKEKITALKENLQVLTAHSSNAIVNGAGIAANIAATAAEKFQERQIALLTQQEIDEDFEFAKLSIYVAEDRPKIAECVANILTYHHQLLILRLNGGDSGYMELARFNGKAIEIFALDKLRAHENQVNALVDAAIPKSDSRLYYTPLPHPFKKGFKKTLEIDPNTNDLLRRCGPAVQSILGKIKNSQYYSIQQALNHPFIIDPQGHIFTGATSTSKKSYILNSENPYPVILIAPNETTAHIGLEHGTTTIDYKLRIEQLKALQRFVPEFLVEDLNHDINQKNNGVATDPTTMVHIEERNEYQWSIERSLLWKERKIFIENGTKGIKQVDPSSTQINHYGMARRRVADIFDARQAKDDVERMLQETTQAFENVKKSEENSSPDKNSNHHTLKEILAEKTYYLVLAVEPLIIYCEKLRKDNFNKESYYNLAIKALHSAKHIMEATRDTPIVEFTKKEEQENKTREKKQLFKRWQELLYFCNDALEITTETASMMQVPQSIHSFVYKNEAKNQSTITDLMVQATTYVAHSNVLMEQMSAIVKFSKYDIEKNTFSENNDPGALIRPLIKITKQSTRYLGENLAQIPKIGASETKSLITNRKSHLSILTNFSIREHDSDEEKSDDIEMTARSTKPNLLIQHQEKHSQVDNVTVIANPNSDNDGLMTQYIKEIVHDIKFARKNLIDSQLEKIQFCTEAITHFRNGIFASLGIDEIKIGRAFKNNKHVELNQVNLKIAIEATQLCESAHQNQQNAYTQRSRARSRTLFSTKRRRARKAIQDCEHQSITQVTQIIDAQDQLNEHYQEAHTSTYHFSTVKVLCTFQRFEQTITTSIPTIVANNDEFSSKIQQMNKLARAYENKLDEDNLKLMQEAYQRMEDLLKEKPRTPTTLNEVIRYHQTVKNCNRKIVHAANGERISTTSSDIMSRFLSQDIDKISANIKSIQKSLINLTRECTTQSNLVQATSTTNMILNMGLAKKQIEDVISRLGGSQNAIGSHSRLTRCDSSMYQENSIDSIKTNVINKIQKLITSINECDDIAPPSSFDLLLVIKEELEANLQTLNNNAYLNWGVWIMAIAARASIAHYQTEVIPREENKIISSTPDPYKIEGKASQLMLDTRKKLLELFHKLDYSMTKPMDEHDDTLESPEEIIDDEIQWSSQFNIEELQKRDRLKIKSKIQKVHEIPSVQLYKDLVKTKRERVNPQKSIYEQLVTYASVFIQNKFNLIHRLDTYLTQLRCDYRYFNDLPIGNTASEWFLKRIQSLHKNINDKIQSEREQKESMVKFEKNLKSRLVVIRIFFQNWKDKTQDPYPKNTLLSSLKEASKARAKEKQRQKAIEAAETEEDDKETKVLSPSSMEHAKKKQSIDYVSLKDIDNLYASLQNEIKQYKDSPKLIHKESNCDNDLELIDEDVNQQEDALSSNKQLHMTPQLEQLPRDNLERSQKKSVSFDELTQQSVLSPKKDKKHRRSNADCSFFQASPSVKAKAQSQAFAKNKTTLSQKKF